MRSILLTILILASCCFGQVGTDRFKQEWKNVAGNQKLDTSTYETLRAFSIGADRKAFVHGLAPADRLNIWRIHIAYALSHFKYSPEQEALVREAIPFLTLDNFIKEHPQEVLNWEKRVRTAFKVDLANQALKDPDLRERIKDDLTLYKYTFEIPGDTEVVSSCRPKQTAPHTEKAAFTIAFIYCNCTWAGGCDDWLPCGQPCSGCRIAINCGIFEWQACSGFCGACCNGSC